MKRSLVVSIMAIAVVVIAACSEDKWSATTTQPQKPRASATPQASGLRTIDDDFDDLSTLVPGFGGAFISRDGVANVYATNPGRPGLLTALRANLSPRLRDRQIRVLQGQYDFHQLRTWKDQVTNILNDAGVVSIDADEMRNRVVVAVSDAAVTDQVLARGVQLGVPQGAILIDVVHPSDVHSTLDDNGVGTLRTGLIVAIADSSIDSTATIGECTIGVLAAGMSDSIYAAAYPSYTFNYEFFTADLWQDKYYVMTNSHCSGADTARMGHTHPGIRMYQFGSPVVADKYFDPPFVAGGFFCPTGKKCRTSDAAAYTLRGTFCPWLSCSSSGAYSGFGTAYRTTTPWGDSTTAGSNTIDAVNGPWSIVHHNADLSIGPLNAGDSVLKIGRNTGTTVGFVVGTCLTMNESENGVPTGIALICNYRADLKDVGGDSGAGVFVRAGSNSLYLTGLSWGGGTYANGVYFDNFSDWNNIRGEMGPIGHRFGPVCC